MNSAASTTDRAFVTQGKSRRTALLFLLCALLIFQGWAGPKEASADYTLSVTLFGWGGSVNSNPSGIACVSGDSTNCSKSFPNSTEVTLTAYPDWKSLFAGWGLPCGGTGSCIITLDGDAGVTATFAVNGQAKVISGHDIVTEYGSLQDVYVAANNFGIVAARIYTFTENLTLNDPITVTLDLGKDTDYLSPATGYTTLQGTLTIAHGTARISNLIIK